MKLQYNTPIPNSSHEKINVIDLRNIYLILGDDVKI